MTEQETKDLEEMKAKIQELKLSIYDYMVHLSECSEEQLKMSGHRFGQLRAIADTLRNTQNRIRKAHQEYLKKYPD